VERVPGYLVSSVAAGDVRVAGLPAAMLWRDNGAELQILSRL
jgi:fructose-1-phosphate kinase PfkB-like protein